MTNVNISKFEKEIQRVYNKRRVQIRELWNVEDPNSLEWTKETKRIFVEIGKEFGYDLHKNKIDETRKMKIWQSKEPKEFMSIDQVWFDMKEKPIVGIESENNAKFDVVINDEFQKLLFFKSKFKILIWYVKISEEDNRWDEYKKKYLECFQKEIEKKSNNNEYFVNITMARPFVNTKKEMQEKEKNKIEWRMYTLQKGRKFRKKEMEWK